VPTPVTAPAARVKSQGSATHGHARKTEGPENSVGHRARLRQRLLDAGPNGFHDYELVITNEAMWQGSVDEASVHVREVIARAIALGATSLIIVHNHPSGDATPSNQDIRLTAT
jgi:DNA repair protein RadC